LPVDIRRCSEVGSFGNVCPVQQLATERRGSEAQESLMASGSWWYRAR